MAPKEQKADEQAKWEEAIGKRGVKNERYVAFVDHPAMDLLRAALDRQGLSVFYRYQNPGYSLALVQEFYKHMIVPADFRADDAEITSRIGRVSVSISVSKIAGILHYTRPQGETNFPRPEDDPVNQQEVIDSLYENQRDYTGLPHKPGKLRPTYRLVNQLVCYSLHPRGTENKPGEYVGSLMWAFMDPGTVCDWAMFIFREMVEYRRATTKTVRMPFPCLLSSIFWGENLGLAKVYHVHDTLDPGEINLTVLQRSMGQTGGAHRSTTVLERCMSQTGGAHHSTSPTHTGGAHRSTSPTHTGGAHRSTSPTHTGGAHRSATQTHTGGAPRSTTPLTTFPAPEAKIKVWLKKLFYQNVAIMDSQRKLKKMLKVLERSSMDNNAKLHYCIQLLRGETSAPYVPRDWPELEVSDDFAGQDNENEDEQERSPGDIGLSYSSSGSENVGDGPNRADKIELATELSISAQSDIGMNEEQRQKLRRLEVALMEYREALEEDGIKKPEDADRKVAIHKRRLLSEYGLLDLSEGVPANKISSSERDRRDGSCESSRKRHRIQSESESPPRKSSNKEKVKREVI